MLITPHGERYYSLREAAESLGLSKPRVHQLIKAKRLECRRFANVLAIPASSLQKLLQIPRRRGRPKQSS